MQVSLASYGSASKRPAPAPVIVLGSGENGGNHQLRIQTRKLVSLLKKEHVTSTRQHKLHFKAIDQNKRNSSDLEQRMLSQLQHYKTQLESRDAAHRLEMQNSKDEYTRFVGIVGTEMQNYSTETAALRVQCSESTAQLVSASAVISGIRTELAEARQANVALHGRLDEASRVVADNRIDSNASRETQQAQIVHMGGAVQFLLEQHSLSCVPSGALQPVANVTASASHLCATTQVRAYFQIPILVSQSRAGSCIGVEPCLMLEVTYILPHMLGLCLKTRDVVSCVCSPKQLIIL